MKVRVTDRRKAGKTLLSTNTGNLVTHIVSFGTPEREQRPPAAFYHHTSQKIRFEFHDIEKESDIYIVPKEEDINRLIDFYKENILVHENPDVLIHCYAGVSRSTAAALILLYMDIGDVTEAVNELLRIRPQADPNMLMIEFADNILNKEGAFFREVRYALMAWNPSMYG